MSSHRARAEQLDESLRSTYELIHRAYPEGIPADEYFPLLAVFEPTDISARSLGKVLEAIDGQPYASHYYLFVHELPHKRPGPAEITRAREKLELAGFSTWLNDET